MVGRFVNADVVLPGTGGEPVEYNLFAYCYNNPVNLYDPSGCEPTTEEVLGWIGFALLVVAVIITVVCLAPVLAPGFVVAGGGGAAAGVIVGGGGGALAGGGAAAGSFYLASTLMFILSMIAHDVDSPHSRGDSNGTHFIYVMKDAVTDEVRYVGRTQYPARRQSQHESDPSKIGLKPLEIVYTCSTREQAMVEEQLLVSACTLEHLQNKRREIAPNKLENFVDEISYLITLYETVAESEWLEFLGK